MKILHFIDSLDYGGAETLLMNYVPLLPEYDHIVVTLRGPNVYQKVNYEYIELNLNSVKDFIKAVLLLRKIISEKQVQIVHSHSFWTNIISRFATPRKVKLINHYHFADYETMKQKSSVRRMIFLDKLTSTKSLIRVAVSGYVSKILQAQFQGSAIVVIPNFIECAPVKELQKTPGGQSLKVIAVGNCNYEKNYDLVLQAFSAMKDEPISIDIIGGGGKLAFYQDEVKRLGLEKVHFLGFASDVRQRLTDYDLFLSASLSETFGIAVLEGVCAGLPLLLSDIPAFREVAPGCACFFDPYNTADLTNQLKSILKKSLQFDEKEYEKVILKYSPPAFLLRLRNLYES